MEMTKCLLAIMISIPTQIHALEVVPTPEEEKAFMAGMMGMMARLEDPAWIKLALEKGDGCWLDKTTLVTEGTTREFEGVPSTCISWALGVGDDKGYIFFPSRWVQECDRAKVGYRECVQ
jgi:hypothetical protein